MCHDCWAGEPLRVQRGQHGRGRYRGVHGIHEVSGSAGAVSSYGNVSMASITNGRSLFASTGCALCHTPTLTTGSSSTAALSQKPANLLSDLAVHHMGSNL